MKERPIIFSSEMVKAILDGRKTQTRRVLRKQPIDILPMNCPDMWVTLQTRDPNHGEVIGCRYGIPGDRLWVRETFLPDPPIDGWDGDFEWNGCGRPISGVPAHYRKPEHCLFAASWRGTPLTWRPSIFMPRWASRITLEITGVRVERVQEISEADAIAEGTTPSCVGDDLDYLKYRAGYMTLWDTINAERGFPWKSNPWVWVIEFKNVSENQAVKL